jgi:hypothetical protein
MLHEQCFRGILELRDHACFLQVWACEAILSYESCDEDDYVGHEESLESLFCHVAGMVCGWVVQTAGIGDVESEDG